MKKKNIFLGMFVLMFGILIIGCTTRLGSFTVISTKNIDWSRAPEFIRSNKRVEGQDLYHIIVFIPTKPEVMVDEAVNMALQQIPGSIALVDAVLKYKAIWVPFIYGRQGYIVEGSVLVDPKLAVSDINSTIYLTFHTQNGKEFIKTEISEAEYLSYFK